MDYSTIQPLAYFPLDGDGIDASGNGLNASFIDASGTYDRYGDQGAAMYFEANNMQAPVNPGGNSAFTVSSWVYWNGSTEDFREIWSWWSTSSTSKVYLGPASGSAELRFGDAWGNTGAHLPANQWTYLVTTYDGSEARIYFDGELVAINDAISFDLGTGDFYLATQGETGGEFFDGSIDEVKIYDIALPESAIQTDYEAQKTDLIAYYAFEGKANLNDGVGGYHLEDLSFDSFWTDDRLGRTEEALSVSTTGALEASGFAGYNFGDELTIMGWIKPESYSAESVTILSNIQDGNGISFRLVPGDLDIGATPSSRKLWDGGFE